MATPPNNYFATNVITIPSPGLVTGGNGSIEIPKIKVGTIQDQVMASLDFYQTDTWKSLNPRIFLFTPKKRRRQMGNPGDAWYKSARSSRIVHPTHLAGGNVKWWGGINKYTEGGALILRHTEFQLPTTVPYTWFNLNNLGLNSYEWCVYVDTASNSKRQTTAADFPVPSSNLGGDPNGTGFYMSLGKKVGYERLLPIGFSSQKKKFKFAIVIDNPNATTERPFLIGPMSDAVVLRFKKANDLYGLSFTPDHISKIIT